MAGNLIVHGFFPREDDVGAHWKLLESVPNLDVYAPLGVSAEEAARQKGSIVKDSLGNVMRRLRPMVVIDEGHHAYTETALSTVDGFNPSFVIELSASPRAGCRRRRKTPSTACANVLNRFRKLRNGASRLEYALFSASSLSRPRLVQARPGLLCTRLIAAAMTLAPERRPDCTSPSSAIPVRTAG